jgi:hypothetical protein
VEFGVGTVRQNDEVLYPVVVLHPVDVVHCFGREQRPSQVRLHHYAMLSVALAPIPRWPVLPCPEGELLIL